MSRALCADYESLVREAKREARQRRAGYLTPALLAHDTEHGWRDAGEWAIREEMERRVEAWLRRTWKKRKAS